MCYLCLEDFFSLEMPKTKEKKAKERALEIKQLLKSAEETGVCNEGDKIVDLLKEEQYKLSREM